MIALKVIFALFFVTVGWALHTSGSEAHFSNSSPEYDANFGLNLLGELEVENGGVGANANIVIAPNGLYSTLAMLLAGAKGQTAVEIENAIGYVSISIFNYRMAKILCKNQNFEKEYYRLIL